MNEEFAGIDIGVKGVGVRHEMFRLRQMREDDRRVAAGRFQPVGDGDLFVLLIAAA